MLAQQPIMLSPVILGVKDSTAQRLGWAGNPNVTWKDIAVAAKAGQFHFAMTDPSASNSGSPRWSAWPPRFPEAATC